jgi:Trypsin
VSVGSSYRSGNRGLILEAFRLIRHPRWFVDENRIQADVAVVRLLVPLIFSPIIQPIPLGNFTVNAGDWVMVTGWGFKDNEGTFPERLQRVEQRAMSNLRCWLEHRHSWARLWVTPEMVCLSSVPGQGVCGTILPFNLELTDFFKF